MNSNTQIAKGPLNSALWILAVALVVAGVYGNAYFGGESLLYRVLGMLVVAIAAAMVAFQTVQGKAFWVLLKVRAQRFVKLFGLHAKRQCKPP